MRCKWHYNLLFPIILAAPVVAQVDHASLNGTVSDSSGGTIRKPTLTSYRRLPAFALQVLTNCSRNYQIPGLSIGAYTVTASKAGFRSVEFKNVDLAVGQPRTIDIQMEVGTVAGAVGVNAAGDHQPDISRGRRSD